LGPEILTEKELMEKKPWLNPGKWFGSPITWLPEVRATLSSMPKEVHIQETTLREGEDNASVSFNMEQRVEIARRLSDMGVSHIDVGDIGNPLHVETLKTIMSAGVVKPPTRIQIFTRAHEVNDLNREVDKIVKYGATAIGFISWDHWDLSESIKYCKTNYPHIYVTFGYTGTTGRVGARAPKDATMRSSFDWQIEFAKKMCEAGADRIQMSDSMGCGSPAAIRYLSTQFKEAIGPKKSLLLHAHNDYGQAVANAVAAVEAGVDWLDTAVNGLGDRAGNTALEEVVMVLECLYGIKTGIKLEKLYEVSKYLQEASGVRVQSYKAIVGDRVWMESGHARMLIRWKRKGVPFFEAGMETWNPQIIGSTHELVFGKASFIPEVIKGFLEYLKLPSDENTVNKIYAAGLKQIDERIARGEDRFFTEDEVNSLCKKMAGKT